MSEIPYTPLTSKIQKYFEKIQEAGVPQNKVDSAWLKSAGFAGGNDGYILTVLKFIGFIDDSKLPSELWKKYKGDPTGSRSVLAQAIKTGYSDLFSLYKDANRKDREALYAYFSSKTGKAKRTVDLMVATFTALCTLADFGVNEATSYQKPTEIQTAQSQPAVSIVSSKGTVPEIHINIQLHLPPTSDPTVFDNLFKSMKKYLLSAEE